MNLKQLCFEIFKSKSDRQGIQKEFKPVFTRYVGIEDNNDYNNILKTLIIKSEENKDTTILFNNEIPFIPDFGLINYINAELLNIDINNLKQDDVVLFNNPNINNIFINSLQYIINLSNKMERFDNKSIQNNFIMKIILWTYNLIREMNFESLQNTKCIYYGTITKHEIYFLLMLYKMGFDVVYINPLKNDVMWDKIDEAKLSTVKQYNMILPIGNLYEITRNANVLEYNQSYLYQVEKQFEQEFFNNGIYKPWQFRGYNTTPITSKISIHDIGANWNEQARLRDGFKVDANTVFIPNIFAKIDGIYRNMNEYSEFISKLYSLPLSIVFKDEFLINDWSQFQSDMFSLSFCRLSDGSFNIEELKKLHCYQFRNYKLEIQDLLLNKINEVILSEYDLFNIKLEKEKLLTFVMDILFLKPEIIRLVDNFDFTADIPKIIMFIENENTLSERTLLILGFLHKIGLDIIILNPSGMLNAVTVINPDRLNVIRLDQMKYNLIFDECKKSNPQKRGFWGRKK